jgi:hypothetical protein
MRTVEFIAPGMAIKGVNAAGKLVYHEVTEKLRKRFENTKTNLKIRDLKIKPGNTVCSNQKLLFLTLIMLAHF